MSSEPKTQPVLEHVVDAAPSPAPTMTSDAVLELLAGRSFGDLQAIAQRLKRTLGPWREHKHGFGCECGVFQKTHPRSGTWWYRPTAYDDKEGIVAFSPEQRLEADVLALQAGFTIPDVADVAFSPEQRIEDHVLARQADFTFPGVRSKDVALDLARAELDRKIQKKGP